LYIVPIPFWGMAEFNTCIQLMCWVKVEIHKTNS
jgi:hypothetical protein